MEKCARDTNPKSYDVNPFWTRFCDSSWIRFSKKVCVRSRNESNSISTRKPVFTQIIGSYQLPDTE